MDLSDPSIPDIQSFRQRKKKANYQVDIWSHSRVIHTSHREPRVQSDVVHMDFEGIVEHFYHIEASISCTRRKQLAWGAEAQFIREMEKR